MQAITTRHIAVTDTRPDRIKAECSSGSLTMTYPYESAGVEASHRKVAEALRAKLGWTGDMLAGETKAGFVFVFIPKDSGYVKAPKHRITARTWWGHGGCEWFAELRDVASGNVVFELKGAGGQAQEWEYAMRDEMAKRGLYPDHNKTSPTIYFRDVCGVEYDHNEVARRKDL